MTRSRLILLSSLGLLATAVRGGSAAQPLKTTEASPPKTSTKPALSPIDTKNATTNTTSAAPDTKEAPLILPVPINKGLGLQETPTEPAKDAPAMNILPSPSAGPSIPCDASDLAPIGYPADSAYEVGVGHLFKFDQTSRLEFESVVADGRCPPNARCVVPPGKTTGLFRYTSGCGPSVAVKEFKLDLGDAVVLNGRTVTFTDLQPQPATGKDVQARAKLRAVLSGSDSKPPASPEAAINKAQPAAAAGTAPNTTAATDNKPTPKDAKPVAAAGTAPNTSVATDNKITAKDVKVTSKDAKFAAAGMAPNTPVAADNMLTPKDAKPVAAVGTAPNTPVATDNKITPKDAKPVAPAGTAPNTTVAADNMLTPKDAKPFPVGTGSNNTPSTKDGKPVAPAGTAPNTTVATDNKLTPKDAKPVPVGTGSNNTPSTKDGKPVAVAGTAPNATVATDNKPNAKDAKPVASTGTWLDTFTTKDTKVNNQDTKPAIATSTTPNATVAADNKPSPKDAKVNTKDAKPAGTGPRTPVVRENKLNTKKAKDVPQEIKLDNTQPIMGNKLRAKKGPRTRMSFVR